MWEVGGIVPLLRKKIMLKLGNSTSNVAYTTLELCAGKVKLNVKGPSK